MFNKIDKKEIQVAVCLADVLQKHIFELAVAVLPCGQIKEDINVGANCFAQIGENYETAVA